MACVDVCQELGYDGYDHCEFSETAGHDQCLCYYDETPECECAEGQTQCSGDSVLVCDDGCTWTTYDCETACAESDEWDYYTGQCAYEEASGRDVCICANCECAEGDQACSGDYLYQCSDGCTWTYWSCVDICENDGFDYYDYCGYSEDQGVDLCFCGYYD
jgi:hypothetical protein